MRHGRCHSRRGTAAAGPAPRGRRQSKRRCSPGNNPSWAAAGQRTLNESVLRRFMNGVYNCVCQTDSMSSQERRRGAARDLSRAVAERDRGRRRLKTATATVSFASVAVAGVVAVVLPGSTHKTATSSNSSSSGSSAASGTGSTSSGSTSSGSGTSNAGSSNASNSSNSGSSNSGSSNSSNSSGNLQAPSYTPAQSGGGGQSTSGEI